MLSAFPCPAIHSAEPRPPAQRRREGFSANGLRATVRGWPSGFAWTTHGESPGGLRAHYLIRVQAASVPARGYRASVRAARLLGCSSEGSWERVETLKPAEVDPSHRAARPECPESATTPVSSDYTTLEEGLLSRHLMQRGWSFGSSFSPVLHGYRFTQPNAASAPIPIAKVRRETKNNTANVHFSQVDGNVSATA